MVYYTKRDAIDAFGRSRIRLSKSADQILRENVQLSSETDLFDIFLSHCLSDSEQVAGVKALLEEQGFKVYVDWIVDRHLDRTSVNAETAETLRRRMKQCSSMFFVTSSVSPNSKWMPWELGYFDGLKKGRISILPLVENEASQFAGQEYLGLYPVIEKVEKNGKNTPVVSRARLSGIGREYMGVKDLLTGSRAFKAIY